MNQTNIKFLRGVALVSAVFAGLVCILVIANYFQINSIDPVNTEIINQLVERLQENPNDEELRNQIRELDLLARKAYFTNTWQVKTGGYLILIALAIFVIAYQLMDVNVKKQVLANPDQPQDILGIQKNARIGISMVGGILITVALILTFLTHSQLTPKIQLATNGGEELVVEETVTEIPLQVAEVQETPTETVIEEQAENTEEQIVEEKQPEVVAKKPETKVENKPKPKEKPVEKKSLIPTAEALKQNFASFRGYQSNGIVYQDNVPQIWNGTTGDGILWKVPIPVQGYNSPIVWNDKIFLTGATNEVREVFCFSKASGELLWRHKVEGIPGSPATAPKTTSDTGLAAPTMTTDGQRVYAIFGTGDVLALDFDGNMLWGKNLGVPQNHYGHSSSLLMYKDKLLVQYDQKSGGQIMALDGKTGTELWSTARKVKISWASPVLVEHKGKAQVILSADPFVAGYDPETGAELWKLNCIFGEVGPSIHYSDGIVYAMNEYAIIAAIDLDDPSKTLWESDELLSDVPSPIAKDGMLLIPASYGIVALYDGKTGEFVWENDFGNNIYSSPLLVGNNVYLMDMTGLTHIFKLTREGYQEVASNPLGEDAVCTPAIADGRIYIRSDKNLYCIGNL